MPVLRYLADTNSVSDYFKPGTPVKQWFATRRGEVALSTFTVAELRRGIELRQGKSRLALERTFRFLLEDYRGMFFVFDEAAAFEWGRLMAEARNHPLPLQDSQIGAIARASDLTVVTRNIKHFPGCRTVNPWDGVEHAPWRPSLSS